MSVRRAERPAARAAPPGRPRTFRVLLAIAMLLIIVLLGGALTFFVTGVSREARNLPLDPVAIWLIATGDDDPVGVGPTQRFVVEKGDTAASISERLAGQGLVKNSTAFRFQARAAGLDAHLEAGEYELAPSMRPSEIMDRLQHGRNPSQALTIPEGWRLAQIADAVEAKRPGSRDELIAAATSSDYSFGFLKDKPPTGTLEGYLFPDTYQVEPDTQMRKLVERMLGVFEQRVAPDTIARAKEKGLTLHQLVTIASIVEREAQAPSERQTIASVFLNRMKGGMMLQADPTVQYALWPTNAPSPDGKYWKPISGVDLRLDSVYNTYRVRGLPPGPICSPGVDAIQAVVDAAPTDYLYFVAKSDGTHLFARTLAEHNQNVARVGASR